MIPTDYLEGSFEFDTDLAHGTDGKWHASAMGYKASHEDQSQAINDLNQLLNTAIESGKLVPNMGS
jgi:hypothetical protein